MRRVLALLLALTATPALAAPPLAPDHLARPAKPPEGVPKWVAKPQAFDAEYPLPQDREVMERRRADRVAWLRSKTLDVFNAHGNTAAPWADQARAALDAYAIGWSRRASTQSGVYYGDFLVKLRAALAAGCDDPLIEYWRGHFLHDSTRPGEAGGGERRPITRGSVARLAASRYPAAVKMHSFWNGYVHMYPTDKLPKGSPPPPPGEYQFLEAFAEAARDADLESREYAHEFATHMLDRFVAFAADRPAAYASVQAALVRANAPEWTRKAVAGHYLIKHAWDARGVLTADKTTDAQFAEFRVRIEQARTALEAAWVADPSSAVVAKDMVVVAMALSWDRAEMEKWFARAMTADPDSAEACRAKLECLQPKWGGTELDALAFCTQLYRSENYYALLPLVGRYPDTRYGAANAKADWKAFYASQKTVWPLVRAAHETHLSVYPGDPHSAAVYARAASEAGKWAVAAAQYAAVGDDPPGWVILDLDLYRKLRGEAEAKAQAEAAKP